MVDGTLPMGHVRAVTLKLVDMVAPPRAFVRWRHDSRRALERIGVEVIDR
ncbi:hypothetical protein [Nannocystis bainbridge]|uniref:Uncharacterized protein n=1 Tax=Nannocystis bainbridge TaxID=2995303 RepID=A0ABT5E9T7_9BACT|nr:hypothetical protein [Nannocystis bainbridge]MDC0722124.1 hypothetical protein [Nannocystis bainbridge]